MWCGVALASAAMLSTPFKCSWHQAVAVLVTPQVTPAAPLPLIML